MQIVCPNCATSYEVKAAALGDAGRSVRCARCRNTWFAAPVPAEPELTAPAQSPDGEPVGKISPQPKTAASEDGADTGTFDWSFSAEDTDAGGSATSRGAATDDDQPPAGSALGQDDVDALFGPSEAAPVEDTEAPPLVPALEPETFLPEPRAPAAEPDHLEPDNIENVAARRTASRRKGGRLA